MLPELREHILGKNTVQEQAILKGYRRFKVKGRTYPGIIKDSCEQVRGVLISPLNIEDYSRLDHYEGLEYLREETLVYNESLKQDETVQVYVFNEVYQDRITKDCWDLSQLDIQSDGLMS